MSSLSTLFWMLQFNLDRIWISIGEGSVAEEIFNTQGWFNFDHILFSFPGLELPYFMKLPRDVLRVIKGLFSVVGAYALLHQTHTARSEAQLELSASQ